MFLVPYKQNLILEFDYYLNDQDGKYTLVQTQARANYSLENRVLLKSAVQNFIALYSSIICVHSLISHCFIFYGTAVVVYSKEILEVVSYHYQCTIMFS